MFRMSLLGSRFIRAQRSAARVLLIAVLIALPAAANASEDTAYKAAVAAFEGGNFAEALKQADAGLAVSREARLLYLKARTLWRLDRFEESWSLMNAIRPNELPDDQQEGFVAEYAKMELEIKSKRKEKAENEAASAQAKRQLQDAADAHNTALLMFIGAGAISAGGAVIMALAAGNATEANDKARDDPGTHADYHDRYGSASTMYWSGIGLIAVGAGVGTWGLIKWLGADTPASAMDLQPRIWRVAGQRRAMHGLSLSARF